MKPVSRAKGLKMYLDQKRCLIFVSLGRNDDTEFADLPLAVDVLMNMETKGFAVHSHKVTNLEHYEPIGWSPPKKKPFRASSSSS